jgi:hypothetical protein
MRVTFRRRHQLWLSVGAQSPVNFEAGIGGGYARIHYREYPCESCGTNAVKETIITGARNQSCIITHLFYQIEL